MKRLSLVFMIFLFTSADLQAQDADLEDLVQAFSNLGERCCTRGQEMRKMGSGLRDLSNTWCTGNKDQLKEIWRNYQQKVLGDGNDAQKHYEEMLNKKSEALKGVRSRDPDDRVDCNCVLREWNEYCEQNRAAETLLKKCELNYDFSSAESARISHTGCELMNLGMALFFRGCDLGRESEILEEYGLKITMEEFKRLSKERAELARGPL